MVGVVVEDADPASGTFQVESAGRAVEPAETLDEGLRLRTRGHTGREGCRGVGNVVGSGYQQVQLE